MKHLYSHARYSILSLALMAALAAPTAFGATLTTDPTAADSDGTGASDGKCSLREAVLSVNAGTDVGDCVADTKGGTELYGTNDTIMLQAGTYTLTKGGLDETVNTSTTPPTVDNVPNASIGDLDLLKSVRIIGAGSANTKVEWNPAANTSDTTDRIFHIYTTDVATANDNVVIEGVTLASGKTFEVDLGVDPNDANFHYYFRRAGGAIAMGAAAAVVHIDTTKTGSDNANAGGLGGSTGGESGATSYSLSLTDVVVENSSAQGDGGGLYLAAPTTATNLVVRNNLSTTNGGGIYNEANTTILNSTFSGNQAEGGGGLFMTGSNTVSIAGSTFSTNRAVGGGALSGRSGVTVNIVNSTLSGNLGSDVGAGFYANGPSSLAFVTIADNIAGADSPAAGSGINIFPSGSVAVTLKDVLLANNKKGWDSTAEPNGPADPAALPSANCGYTGGASGAIITAGHNLSSDDSCTSDLHDTTDINGVDPLLGPLANNGGLTQTHALLAGSPALGKGVAIAGVIVDQRGVTRDVPPDIGAYEVPTPAAPGTSAGGSSSSGGCVFDPNGSSDPVLFTLLGLAIAGVIVRRRRQDASKH